MGIYQTCFDLVEQYIYGTVTVGSYQELVCIAVATIASLFVMAIPFIVVWCLIKLIIGLANIITR